MVRAMPGYAAGPDQANRPNETAIAPEPSPEENETAVLPEPSSEEMELPLPDESMPSDRLCRCLPPRQPAWYFQADALALRREFSSDRSFAALAQAEWTEAENPNFVDPPTEGEDQRTEEERARYLWSGTTSFSNALTVDDTNLDHFQGGGRLLLGRTLGANSAVEVAYFDMADWRGTAVVRDNTPIIVAANKYAEEAGDLQPFMTLPGSLFSPLSEFGAWVDPVTFPSQIPFDGNNLTEIRYSSSLNNLEGSFRHWMVRVPEYFQASLLLGVRYMNVDEAFFYHAERDAIVPAEGLTVSAASTSVTTDTANPLIGAQIGGTYEIRVTRGWWLDGELKFALMNNSASQETLFVHDGDDDYQGTHLERAERNTIASAVDATFATKISLSRHVTLDVGYQLLYVSGLALASNNFSDDPDILLSGPGSVLTNGSVLYHGAHVGLMCVW
ncbi:MAG TPA: BBP7 family outer membrane beta-barrel protein [Thermoguttaceae bacterium]|nr:BBP7 family outer membrane beta-barrel protein [Thermoguttaceae bacterium]